MNTLKVPKYREYESKIVSTKGQDKDLVKAVRQEVVNFVKDLDYIMTRFLDQFGSKLEEGVVRNDVYVRFTAAKSKQYAEATRMLRLIDYYSK
jgi:hypothetical protein